MREVMDRQFVLMVLAIVLVTDSTFSQEDANGKWGHLKGQVVLEPKRDHPKLKKHFQDIPLARPLTIRPDDEDEEVEVVKTIPNQTLIVDPKTKGVKNALVFLPDRRTEIHPGYKSRKLKPQKLHFSRRQFHPRVLTLEVGQILEMTADEKTDEATNFKGTPRRNPPFNVLVKPGGPPFQWTPERGERGRFPFAVSSSIHPTAKAFVLIKANPYMTVTNAEGRFELKNVPAGSHELVIWHETTGWVVKDLKVDVADSKTTTLKSTAITLELLDRNAR